MLAHSLHKMKKTRDLSSHLLSSESQLSSLKHYLVLPGIITRGTKELCADLPTLSNAIHCPP